MPCIQPQHCYILSLPILPSPDEKTGSIKIHSLHLLPNNFSPFFPPKRPSFEACFTPGCAFLVPLPVAHFKSSQITHFLYPLFPKTFFRASPQFMGKKDCSECWGFCVENETKAALKTKKRLLKCLV